MVEEKKTKVIGAQRLERANYSGLILSDLSALYKILRSNPDGKIRRDGTGGDEQESLRLGKFLVKIMNLRTNLR